MFKHLTVTLFPPQSKAMRERWLLQGMAAEEGEARRKQLEQDEEQGRSLENLIHRWVAYILSDTCCGIIHVSFPPQFFNLLLSSSTDRYFQPTQLNFRVRCSKE